ncbi:16S rRNA (adenine(1518)-N(6)/adenine(1519)-N(6))-dimethyltransferase RsmA [Mycoplasmopsis caviae]|uniref:Ribosomal RNA small subunit methyltransferase A n=1 Tax=Mycoplasmopsis caviae TaxID=55603 RepID=A0A3P8KWF7_9BACT|nr:16S rRNA (adenine(1518)-N(6)/adenine(1519)-N(6))-dimethyltransferase RsmA [Mycoplasmopsis caviae]UUD35497.1 16S rRNA (adenine(1518)-N(6)/adenine(1519)-N(6))-dimethyltransferase RsmA [Mycoplasmopsis caviae]VDR41727.1 dimethyladenosine transferase rRNA modification enzyme [Mycoplasmopsis caviae]
MFQESKIKAKKKYGQNFLNDQNTIKKIIDIINPKDQKIIEIGPGKGALSKILNQQASELVAFEIDTDMVNYLLNNDILDNNQIVVGDFLTADLGKFKDYIVVGNIPYYITSDIIFKLLENRHNFKKAILMVQNEVAQRLVAKVNESEYSKLSITVQYCADVKKELFVKKSLFDPIPKVDSAIVSLTFKQQKDDNFEELSKFFKLCFLARRKKLTFALATKYSNDKIKVAYSNLNLKELVRIQELDLNTILALYEQLEK